MNTYNISIADEKHEKISIADLCSTLCNTLNTGINTNAVVITTNESMNTNNKLATILDFDKCKSLIEQAVKDKETYIILCPNYSINVQSKYEDCEALEFDLDELEQYIGHSVEVNDYNDLIVDLSNNE